MSGGLNHRRLQVHAGDWQKLTRHLTLAQKAVAMELRLAAWTHRGLDPDPYKLARLAGCRSDHWRTRYADAVLELFELRDGLLVFPSDADQLARGGAKPVADERQRRLPLLRQVPSQCSPTTTEKPREINGAPRVRARAAPDPLKKESLVGVNGVTDARAAGRARSVSSPADARDRLRAPPGAPTAGLGASEAPPAGQVAPMLATKPAAASVRRPRDGPGPRPLAELLGAVVSDELRGALARFGQAVGDRGG